MKPFTCKEHTKLDIYVFITIPGSIHSGGGLLSLVRIIRPVVSDSALT
jgi:hypothetical protein